MRKSYYREMQEEAALLDEEIVTSVAGPQWPLWRKEAYPPIVWLTKTHVVLVKRGLASRTVHTLPRTGVKAVSHVKGFWFDRIAIHGTDPTMTIAIEMTKSQRERWTVMSDELKAQIAVNRGDVNLGVAPV